MEREAFIANIANRLGRTGVTDAPTRPSIVVPPSYADMPLGAANEPQSQWALRFKSEVDALGGKAYVAESVADVGPLLRAAIADGRADGPVCTWHRAEFHGFGIDWLWNVEGAVSFSAGNSSESDIATLQEQMRGADIGVTTAQIGIVNTGTLVLRTNEYRNRSVSLLPRHHIALVRESVLVPRMGPALAGFPTSQAGSVPSSIHFITGPSRSADIENDLTIGVHGPAALSVIVCRGV